MISEIHIELSHLEVSIAVVYKVAGRKIFRHHSDLAKRCPDLCCDTGWFLNH